MFRGATSKVILAHLPPRTIVNLWRDHRREIVANGMGPGFEDFKAALRELRREPVNVSSSEVDEGRTGIAAPIFDPSGRVNGSLSICCYLRLPAGGWRGSASPCRRRCARSNAAVTGRRPK
jgi:DNA-binding IclR family transcriptional regulator